MKRYLIAAAAALVMAGSASAQDDKAAPSERPGREKRIKEHKDSKHDKGKLEEYDEIIIKRKDGDKDAKVTVEIKDGEVFVDGKPIDAYVDDELSVQQRSINRFRLDGPHSPFRFEGGNWMMEGDDVIGEDRPFLGVMTEGSSNGARVEEVTKNSAADKAGLKNGDVITRVDDKEVFDHEGLSGAIGDHKPGDKVTITYKRDGKEHKTTATLDKRKMPVMAPHMGDMRRPVPPMMFNFDDEHNFENIFEMRNRPRLGIKAQDVEEGNGVKVLEVEEGSAAAKAGIKENDIITSFEGTKVNSASELARAAREAREKSNLKVELQRNGKPQTIEVKVPKKLKTANL